MKKAPADGHRDPWSDSGPLEWAQREGERMLANARAFAADAGSLPDEVVPALYNSISAGVPHEGRRQRHIVQIIPANGWWATFEPRGGVQRPPERLACWALVYEPDPDPDSEEEVSRYVVGMFAPVGSDHLVFGDAPDDFKDYSRDDEHDCDPDPRLIAGLLDEDDAMSP